MKIQVLSDIHLEFGKLKRVPDTDAPVVVAAGDIGPGLSGADWLLRTFPGKPVIYIPGNHEGYTSKYVFEDLEDALETKCTGTNVFFCRDPGRRVDIDDVRFLACTLWTDFRIDGNQVLAMMRASTGMNDFRNIRVRSFSGGPGGNRFSPAIMLARHEASLAWLKGELATPWPGKTVLVTHHAPTPRSLDEVERDAYACCYASDLEYLFESADAERPAIDLAIHGHVHRKLDYVVGTTKTRVVCNPRGYADVFRDVRGFDSGYVVEV